LARDEPLSLYREIRSHGYEASVIASYNVNFPFYERVILPQLQASGCRHNIVLADARQCAAELASEIGAPQLCGSEYSLLPIRAAAAFHPKFVMLFGRRGARVIIGSHNLTVGGFGLNREIGTAFDVVANAEANSPARVAWRFVREWTADFSHPIQRLISSSEQIAPWLSAENETEATSNVLGSSPKGSNLWSQLRVKLPKRVTRVTVVAPYFDASLDFLKIIERELTPKELVIGVHPLFSDIRSDAKRLLGRAKFVDLSRMGGRWLDQILHAKLYCFESPSGTMVVSGSANASAPAWIADGPKRNAEMIVVHDDGAKLWSRLGLNSIAALPELTSESWEMVRTRTADRRRAEEHEHPVPYVATTTSEGFVVGREFTEGASASHVSILNAESSTPVEEIVGEKDERLCVCHDAIVRENATRLEVRRRRGPSRIAIVHHTEALLDKAAGNVRQAFRRALVGLEGDPDQLTHLLAVVEKAVFDSPLGVEPPVGAGRSRESKGETPNPERDLGPMMISASDTLRARHRRRAESTSDLALIIDALIYKLGVGLRRDSDTPSSVRSEEELAKDEDAPEPLVDGVALAKMCRGKINRLFKRMEGQLTLASERKKNVVTQIIQLAAVLGIVEYLRNRESDFDWLPPGEELVDVDREWEFFESTSRCLYGTSSGIAVIALKENGGDFDELTASRGLLTWLALDCGIDTRSVIGDLSQEPDDVRASVEEVGYFLPVVMECAADELATDILARAVAEPRGQVAGRPDMLMKDLADYHLSWAHGLVRGRAQQPTPATRLHVGDIVYPRQKEGSSLGIVVEVQGTKAGILDLDTGESRPFITNYLSRVGSVLPERK
jgi:hypothetical protein